MFQITIFNFIRLLFSTFIIVLSSHVSVTNCQWYSDQYYSRSTTSSCPQGCQCDNYQTECKHLLLTTVPSSLPLETGKLNLLGNRINVIKKADFASTRQLKVLQLSNNRITTIEFGAFDHLTNLEKLKLNRNLIRHLPDGIFSQMKKLQKLDLRDNQIQCITNDLFLGLDNLRVLYLERNKIFWISESITHLKSLKVLQISANKLRCNCHLAWLNRFLKHRSDVIKPHPQSILCSTPFRLSRIPIFSLSAYEFQCAKEDEQRLEEVCHSRRKECSTQCQCSTEGIVKCVDKGLTRIPQDLPNNIVELNLQKNSISVLRQGELSRYKNLKKILLSQNKIVDIEPGAFRGLSRLTSLYLNSNKLKTLRKDSLSKIPSLMFLYLHNNYIECLSADSFIGLRRLYLLHLSENRLKTIGKDTFSNLDRLQYLYLVHNPLHCDCKLRWLTSFLRHREANMVPTATCGTPNIFKNQPIRNLKSYDLQCPLSDTTEFSSGSCSATPTCPYKCRCTGNKVDCSNSGLTDIPSNILPTTEILLLSRNKIKLIQKASALLELQNLKKIDLSNNTIQFLDPDIFVKNTQLISVHLQHNKLVCINNQTFRNLKQLVQLDLSHNEIRCIVSGAFRGTSQLQSLRLDNNRLHCNCQLRWMSKWARNHFSLLTRVGGTSHIPKCASPKLLSGTTVTNLEEKYFTCNNSSIKGNGDSDNNNNNNNSKKDIDNSAKPCNNGDGEADNFCCSIVQNECPKGEKCPSKCRCEFTKVDCSQLQLKDIPEDIPVTTTKLHLDRNNLKNLTESSFAKLTNLKTLVLSYNRITELNPNVLSPLKNLETLILSFNKLQCIHQDAFKGLYKLKVLILQSNDVSTIPYGTFRDMKNLNNIALGQNPFHCDCNIKWLNQFFLNHFLDNGISLCAGPENMKLKSIYHSKPTEFVCGPDTDDTYVTAKCNACMRRPCQNDGVCSLLTHHSYRCQCPHPFHGRNCELRINACFGSPCRNGGSCKNVDNFGNYECVCRKGYRGPRCAENIDDCVNHSCENGAKCIDKVNGYECQCLHGFRGKYCQTKFTYCKDVNPCENSGTCEAQPNNKFRCKCLAGWDGDRCRVNIDECRSHQCQNGATCIDEIARYSCQCRPGYRGELCELDAWQPPPVSSNYGDGDSNSYDYNSNYNYNNNNDNNINNNNNNIDDNNGNNRRNKRYRYGRRGSGGDGGTLSRRDITNYPNYNADDNRNDYDDLHSGTNPPAESVCAYHNCLHGGVCVTDPLNQKKSICRCQNGYSGPICQILDSISLNKMSYIEVRAPSRGYLMPRGNISFYFSTNSTSGILLYQGKDKKYISINLYKGHLKIGFNLGDKIIGPEGYSMAKVHDSKPHFLSLIIEGENLTMYLDNRQQCTLRSGFDAGSRYLTLDTPIYLGGAPTSVMSTAVSKYHIDAPSDYTGCLSRLTFNDRQINFMKYLKAGVSITPGCKLLDDLLRPTLSPRYHSSSSSLPSSSSSSFYSSSAYRRKYPRQHYTPTRRRNMNRKMNRNTKIDSNANKWKRRVEKSKKRHLCQKNVCKNDGVCVVKKKGKRRRFKCVCKKGFAGKTCSKLSHMCRRKAVRNRVKDPDTGCISIRRVRYRYCHGSCTPDPPLTHRMQADIYSSSQKSFFYKPPHQSNTSFSSVSSVSPSSKCCQPFKYRTRRIQFECPSSGGRRYMRGVHFVRRCKCTPHCGGVAKVH